MNETIIFKGMRNKVSRSTLLKVEKIEEAKNKVYTTYVLWMLTYLTFKPDTICNDFPSLKGISQKIVQKVYPHLRLWHIENLLFRAGIGENLKIFKEYYPNKENQPFPTFIGGAYTPSYFLVLAFNENRVVTDGFFIEREDILPSFPEELKETIDAIIETMKQKNVSLEDILKELTLFSVEEVVYN